MKHEYIAFPPWAFTRLQVSRKIAIEMLERFGSDAKVEVDGIAVASADELRKACRQPLDKKAQQSLDKKKEQLKKARQTMLRKVLPALRKLGYYVFWTDGEAQKEYEDRCKCNLDGFEGRVAVMLRRNRWDWFIRYQDFKAGWVVYGLLSFHGFNVYWDGDHRSTIEILGYQ